MFEHYTPTKIHFGNGILESALISILKGKNAKVLLVTGRLAMARSGISAKILSCFQRNDLGSIQLFDQISQNPKLDEVNAATEAGIEFKASHVIGLGGGSTMDAAKAIAAGIGHHKRLDDFFLQKDTPGAQTLPVISIPTTSGTGSEVNKSAIISSSQYGIKTGIRSDYLFPKYAIVDPTLTHSVPLRQTTITGYDVLTHAIETYISVRSTPVTSILSLEAIPLVVTYLPRLVKNLNDTEAREKMSFASMLMGMNLANASTCLPHRLQYLVGAATDTEHAAGLAALYPSWIKNSYACSVEKFNKVGTLLTGQNSVCHSLPDVLDAYSRFMDSIGIQIRLRDLGVTPAMIEEFPLSIKESLANDPAYQVKNIVSIIFKESF